MNKVDKKNNSKKNTKFKENLLKWFESTSIHGLSNINRSKYLIFKILWMIILLISTTACFYIIINSLIDYLKYDVVTKIRIHSETPTDFPMIYICPKNPFLKKNSIEWINKTTNITNLFYKEDLFYIFKLIFSNQNYSDSIKKSFGYSLDEMMIKCFIGSAECYKNNFKWSYNYFYGNCYLFNSEKNSIFRTEESSEIGGKKKY